MLKMYKLNLASRQLCINLLGTLDDLSGNIPHYVRTIRKTFDLKSVEGEIENLQEIFDLEYSDDLSAWETAKKDAENSGREFTARAPRAPRQRSVSWDDLSETPERKFTLDNVYADWLADTLKNKDWRKIKDQQGKEQVINLSIDHVVAIADLSDALRGEDIPDKPEKKS